MKFYYVDAEQKENDFKPILLPWDVHPERDIEWFKKEKPFLSLQSMFGGAAGVLVQGAKKNVDATGGTISEYNDKTIFLNKELFKSSFGKFFSTLAHEMSHVFGQDGQREFSDVLTHLLEQAVQRNKILNTKERILLIAK